MVKDASHEAGDGGTPAAVEPSPSSMATAAGGDLLRRRVKAEIRKRMRGLRQTTPGAACAERSRLLVERLAAHPRVAAARAAALFWPIVERHEVDLRALDATLRARGASVFYLAIDPDSGVMTFRAVADPATLAEAGYGFAEPPRDAAEAGPGEIDVVIVPALAVDARGHRIGYGAGYYDRTLPRFAPPAEAIAVAFDFQLVSELPVVESDVLPMLVAAGFLAGPKRAVLRP